MFEDCFHDHPQTPGPQVIKIFMLNSAEHEIYSAHKCWHFSIFQRIEMSLILAILIFMSNLNFMLS